MRFFKNKIFIGTVSIFLAIVLAVILIPKSSREETGEVIQMRQDVAQNTYITEDLIKTVSIPESAIPDAAIKTEEEVIGQYTTAAVFAGDFITKNKIVEVPANANLYTLKAGEYAISIDVPNLNSSVSAKIIEGDIVSIIGYGPTDDGRLPTDPLKMPNICAFEDLMAVEVLAVTNSDAQDTSAAKMSDDDDDADIIPATLTLKVNEKQARELILLSNECQVSAVFVSRSSTVAATPTPIPTPKPTPTVEPTAIPQ